MSKTSKIIISILGLLVLVVGIVSGVYLVSKNQDIREKAAPNASLSFNPAEISVPFVPNGEVCIYSNGTTRPPHPDASGTCRVRNIEIPAPGTKPRVVPPPGGKPTPIVTKVSVSNGKSITPQFDGTIDTGVVCPMDVRICPDGSSVKRIGTVCDFAPCPTSEPSGRVCGGIAGIECTKSQSFTSSSKISTGTNLITGIDIELIYDPAAIQLIELIPTSALNNFTNSVSGSVIKNEIDNTAGKARFIAYTSDKTLALSGDLEILTVRGTIIANLVGSSYQINYGSLTTLAAVGEGQNVTIDKSPLTIDIVAGTPNPTTLPTPIPTQSASPTPTDYPAWDVNQDGVVNIIDIGIVVDNYDSLSPTTTRVDVNGDGIVNIVDIGIIVDHYQ